MHIKGAPISENAGHRNALTQAAFSLSGRLVSQVPWAVGAQVTVAVVGPGAIGPDRLF